MVKHLFARIRAAWRRRHTRREVARALYAATLAQARQPVFYTALEVPDSVNGRFDLLVLHVYLVIARLKQGADREEQLAQSFFDTFFEDMDHNLRELGVGDLSVGKKVKGMAAVFYGQVAAYETALTSNTRRENEAVNPENKNLELQGVLKRNIYGKAAPSAGVLDTFGTYILAQARHLDGWRLDDLSRGEITFLPLKNENGTRE